FWLRRRVRHSLWLFTAVGAVASFAIMALVFDPSSPTRAYTGTDARAGELLIGALLAIAMRRFVVSPRWSRIIGPAALATVLVAMFVVTDHSRLYYLGGSAALAVVFAALIWAVEA